MNATTPSQQSVTTTEAPHQQGRKLITRMAERFGVDADKLLTTLKATAFRQRNNKEITNEQMMALLVVSDQYKLNPFTKEIYAYEDKGAIIPVVSVDGWSRIINSHEEYDGIEFRYSDMVVTMDGGKLCPDWCEALIYHKNRGRPTIVREYLDEVYVGKRGNPPVIGPWQTHTKRMLRHKTMIQCARVAFGFAGIYDDDEAGRIMEVQVVDTPSASGASTADLEDALRARAATRAAEPVDVDFTDVPKDTRPEAEGSEEMGEDEFAGADDEPDPIALEQDIAAATTDEHISYLVDAIQKVSDLEARKHLTRKALARKTELMRDAGRA